MIKRMEDRTRSLMTAFDAVPWNEAGAYGLWLSQAYYIARRSTSYLGLCMFHSEKNPDFQERCADHIQEERGHEKLIINDLKNLGLSMQPELPSTQAVYQTQYFRIVAESSVSFLGYIFLLEMLAPICGIPLYEKLAFKNARSFLKVHTVADENHIEAAAEILDALTEEQKKMVWDNFEMTARAYESMLADVAAVSLKLTRAA